MSERTAERTSQCGCEGGPRWARPNAECVEIQRIAAEPMRGNTNVQEIWAIQFHCEAASKAKR